MRRLLVNDALNQLGERTFWNLLMEWFDMEFVGRNYDTLADWAAAEAIGASLIIRNATWFPPIETTVPTISLLQDIIPEGPQRKMQENVICRSRPVPNSAFTAKQYGIIESHVIPLPVDFSVFEPQNTMGCQQALSLPDGCVCWVGASQGAAGHVKGWDIMQSIARRNPDIHFVCVFKDAMPDTMPPNMRCYEKLSHDKLVQVIGACRVGLCTSRMESQHLAGIEMGACGLPMIAPRVGVYWQGRENVSIVENATVEAYTVAVRAALDNPYDPAAVRESWKAEFDVPVIKAQWTKLVKEVECSGQS